MKPSCQDVEARLAPYVDREVPADDRAGIDAHLQACPRCRDRATAEDAARTVIHARRDDLRGTAPQHLRARCAALRAAPAPRRAFIPSRVWMPLAAAAVLFIAVVGGFLLLSDPVEAYATQLAMDHVKCFQFVPNGTDADPVVAGQRWQAVYGWPLKVPASAVPQQLVLLGARRCLSSKGLLAHIMYKWRGKPLSVFVLNDRVRHQHQASASDTLEPTSIEKLGERSIIWNARGRTYAVVAAAPAADLLQVASYVRSTAE
jgi:anti-sigma factor (TIGR02949 family)